MKNPNNIVYIRHQAPLTQTISTEAWLHKMAQDGLLLESVQGSKYKFKKGSPADIYYFMMTPETGTNSDSWVFYEFEQKMGKQTPCNGLSLFSPSLMLMAGREEVDRQSELISYYFCYRNYRLLRRFKRNSIGFSIFFILSTFVCVTFRSISLGYFHIWLPVDCCVFIPFIPISTSVVRVGHKVF